MEINIANIEPSELDELLRRLQIEKRVSKLDNCYIRLFSIRNNKYSGYIDGVKLYLDIYAQRA